MISINIDKAKAIGHDIRRAVRASEFEPLDSLIAKQIPGIDAQQAETKRQEIRDKYAAMQTEIDAASSVGEIKAAVANLI